jgi:hypothetical protein
MLSCGWRQKRKSQRSSTSNRLHLFNRKTNNDNNNDKSTTKKEAESSTNAIEEFFEPYNQRLDKYLVQIREFIEQLKTKLNLPPGLMENMPEWVPKLRERLTIGLITFFAGIFFTVGAVLIPVYNEVEALTEPVTLFETILSDLSRGYVDEVDTNKLFETGVSAMLR